MSEIVQLNKITDHSYWISHDRVNACISSECNGLSEIGYHGHQPVSRNSRIFVCDEGVLTFYTKSESGVLLPIVFDTLHWYAFGSEIHYKKNQFDFTIDITAHERLILISISSSIKQSIEFGIYFHPKSLFTNVQGNRLWKVPYIEDSHLYFSFNDKIILRDWIRRTGPYAGDFLIPEPWRRLIYKKKCRSGLAKFDDVVPEFRDSEIPLYNADIFIRIGGNDFTLIDDTEKYVFSTVLDEKKHSTNFSIEFSDKTFGEVYGSQNINRIGILESQKKYFEQIKSSVPKIVLQDYTHVEKFFSNVPALVASCRVHEYGMTRANPGAYYWLWSWDNIVTAMEFFRWGDLENVRNTIQFINAHRDKGIIPGRWTRNLQPLDTPERGALEFLFALLVYEYTVQSGDISTLISAYPFMIEHFNALQYNSDEKGFFKNIGCYPDLLTEFGRTENSIVAMEIAAANSFYRILENSALALHDDITCIKAHEAANRVEKHFIESFWDDEKNFLFDSFDMSTNTRNESYPLFAFLFLQTPLGWRIIKNHIQQISDFISMNHLSQNGINLIPAWDKHRLSEPTMQAWYPHWDIYAIKLLRRGGKSDEIVRWLHHVDQTLEHLGYCPEFLSMLGFEKGDNNPWKLHGAVSNLNCATGWYRAIVEGIIGLEFDPGGITIIPCALPIDEIHVTSLIDRGTTWNIHIQNHGEYIERVMIDDNEIKGCLKIPIRYADKKNHELEICYGEKQNFGFCFTEIINAEVLDVQVSSNQIALTINALGTTDCSFTAPKKPFLFVDGIEMTFNWDDRLHVGDCHLQIYKQHTLILKLPEL